VSTVPASLRRYRADLVAAIDRELEEAQSTRLRRTPQRPWHSRWSVLLVATGVVAVALLMLTVAAPWESSPTILDRAEAAILAPSEGSILYEKITVHPIVFSSRGTVARVQLWLDSAQPRRFRLRFSDAWQAELGGTLGTSTGLNYVAPDHALHRIAFPFRATQSDLDPVAFVRTALRLGHAKLDGRATIGGHDVIRIQLSTWFTAPTGHRLEPTALYYVDAHTYRPVRVVIPPPYGRVVLFDPPHTADPIALSFLAVYPDEGSAFSFGLPMDPSAFLLGSPGYSFPTLPVIPGNTMVSRPRPHRVYDFEQYRLIAPTAANRRLTNVRAIHPRASVP
jgi:hypothetical protein